jgi:uncharacterized protein (DUF2141 family)
MSQGPLCRAGIMEKPKMNMRSLPTLIVALAVPLGGCAVSIGETTQIAQASAPAAASLTIRFDGIESPTGQIMLSMFDSEMAHDQNGAPVRVAAVNVDGSTAAVQVEGIAPGDYAIKAFHDVDGDGQMATNPFGMPLEPFAFSNNARAEGGPAKWDAARFAVVAGANTISITIK